MNIFNKRDFLLQFPGISLPTLRQLCWATSDRNRNLTNRFWTEIKLCALCIQILMVILATRPGFARVQCWYQSVFLLYYACYKHINLLSEPLYLFKKTAFNPLGNFKDISIRKDRQWEATLFYTVMISCLNNARYLDISSRNHPVLKGVYK
jgi:hypothetical protein